MKLPFKVYAVTDPELCLPDLADKVSEAIEGGAGAIQLRDKRSSSLDVFRQAERLRKLTDELGGLLFINDRLDVAMAVGADGVHVGQEDLPAWRIRTMWKGLLGVSAWTPELARIAEEEGADYVGVGPVFPTASKQTTRAPIGPEGLAAVVAAVRIPVVAIGGIDASNCALLAKSGAAAVASVAGIFGDPKGPAEAVRMIRRGFTGC